jgi:hypothetical protein
MERTTGYQNLPKEIRAAIFRGEVFYFGIEFYLPSHDDIFSDPSQAVFRFSDTRFTWLDNLYKDRVKDIPELTKFIGKTFNQLGIEMANVERGASSGSSFVFRNLIRGFRVAVRIIFPELEDIEMSRLVWWGRVSNVQDISPTSVKINCSQEIGDFSYDINTKQYGQACPLFFGKGDCLGTETFEQKSLLYQNAFNLFGQGGCNRTEQRCIQLDNRDFYQGQNAVTVSGQFIRDEVTVKKFLFFFKIHKHNRIPVQWSSKNQSTNDNVTIPFVFGRARIELHPFVWADIGTQIIALVGGSIGPIQGFYNITCQNPDLTIVDVTQHLGEFGGVGTQQPDGRFIQSGPNSKLAYLGITYGGSPDADEPEDPPTTTAVMKGAIIPVRNPFTGDFINQWSNNPVWLTRFFLTNFIYTVVKPEWFNEVKNQDTANYCFTVIEDDTDAEIPVISGSSFGGFQDGEFTRFTSTNRYNADVLQTSLESFRAHNELSQSLSLVDDIDTDTVNGGGGGLPDIWWASPIGSPQLGQSRTYLALRYTANGVINDKAKLSDILFSLLLPTFRGFLRFNHYGQIEIDCRKPVNNSYIRLDTPIASTEIPVASTVKFSTTNGYLLIGVGKNTSEIAKVKGLRYVNGSSQCQVTATSSGGLGVTVSPTFVDRLGAPAEIYMDFEGTPSLGEQVSLKFVDPIDGQTAQNELLWDYYCDSETPENVALLFKTRLMASPSFRESWTAEIFPELPKRIVIRCQTGYVQLDRPLINPHFQGEEVLTVVEVYEDGRDEQSIKGTKDNMTDFRLGVRKQETYHGVTGTYISAVQDFRETQIQPRIAWDAAEQERNLNLLDLDLRFVDNYRQAAFLTKSATIDFVDGNLYATWQTGIRAMFHEEGEVVAVRHQTMEGVSYTPFTIENLSYSHSNMETSIEGKLYLSAAFDERVAKEEKFLEASLVPNPDFPTTPPPTLSAGGYSSTGTGDGVGGRRQDIYYETQTYETLPNQQVYSPEGRDKL